MVKQFRDINIHFVVAENIKVTANYQEIICKYNINHELHIHISYYKLVYCSKFHMSVRFSCEYLNLTYGNYLIFIVRIFFIPTSTFYIRNLKNFQIFITVCSLYILIIKSYCIFLCIIKFLIKKKKKPYANIELVKNFNKNVLQLHMTIYAIKEEKIPVA